MTTQDDSDISRMVGLTMISVINENDARLIFTSTDGRRFEFHYVPDCCASCVIEDVCGDLSDLVGSPLVEADEVSNYEGPVPEYAESYTWTFYRFSTVKGTVTVRWFGESHGYYSESVTLSETGAS